VSGEPDEGRSSCHGPRSGPNSPAGSRYGDVVLLRLARPDDAEATREIYNAEVTGSTVTFDLVPRTRAEQEAWIDQRSGAMAVVVAEVEGRVAGFASLSPYRDRPAYATTVEDSVYVHADFRGRGVGRALLSEVLDIAATRGFHAVMARVVGGHETSIGLHESLGFRIVGTEVEVGRKFGRWLDVVLLQKML
jgi:L-amino acid N-acyltransferase YncA